MKYLLIIGVASLILFCNYSISSSGGDNLNDKVNKRESVFYFEMSAQNINELVQKISRLRIGYKYENIIDILGKPRFDQKYYGKNIDPKTKQPLFKYRALDYYVKIYEKDFANELHDVYVSILLDKEDKLIKIVYYPKGWNEKYSD